MMNKHYRIGGHLFGVEGELLCSLLTRMSGFAPFETEAREGACAFSFTENHATIIPTFGNVQYRFVYEEIVSCFGVTPKGDYLLEMRPEGETPLRMWTQKGSRRLSLSGNLCTRLVRFALWIGYGLMTFSKQTIALHGSCIVYQGQGIVFLGESGTGKSTHTRLWQEHVPGATLLNDDSPVIRWEEGEIQIYGSPWSGKTPCYKAECYPLAGCVRLRQAPFNRLTKLPVLQAYGALHPSCPPEFAYDEELCDEVSKTLDCLLRTVSVYELACLPDKEAVQIVQSALFGKR